MMSHEFMILVVTAASVALIHTLTGPDHYLPFIVISKARNWKMSKTIWFTAVCGLGHVGSSVLLGIIGISFGIAVEKLELVEGVRGSIITYLFTVFGLIYLIWGLRKAYKARHHIHYKGHAHSHEQAKSANVTPWILFTIFIFGPCEPLIPIVMYPAAKHNYMEIIIVTGIFSLITITTMIVLVTVASYGFKLLPMQKIERFSHALAGGTLFACGLGMLFLGL